MGIERATQMIERPLHFADPRRGSHHRAGDHVAMAIQVLGRAVQDQIEPMSQRPEGERRREGVVDDRDQVALPGERSGGGKIGDAQQRVGDRLDIEHARLRRDGGAPGCGIVSGNERHRDSEPRQIVHEQVVRAPVEAVLRNDVIASAEHGEERRAHRRHATGRRQRRFCLLQRCQLGVERFVRGRVREAGVADVVVAPRLRLLERARLVDRHRHRAAVARPRLTGMDQQGIRTHGRMIYRAARGSEQMQSRSTVTSTEWRPCRLCRFPPDCRACSRSVCTSAFPERSRKP